MNVLIVLLGLSSLLVAIEAAGATGTSNSTSLCMFNATTSACTANVDEMYAKMGRPSDAELTKMGKEAEACDDASELLTTTTTIGSKCKSGAPATCETISASYSVDVAVPGSEKGKKITMSECAAKSAKATLLAEYKVLYSCGVVSGELGTAAYEALDTKCKGLYDNSNGGSPKDRKAMSDWTRNVTSLCIGATTKPLCETASADAAKLTPPPKWKAPTSSVSAIFPGLLAATVLLMSMLSL